MSKAPLVSVILPVYNGERFVGTAIESLLEQSLHDFEVIIVDDGSTDASFEICNSYGAADGRIKIIRQEQNRGVVAALNIGLRYASGRFIARFDQDDIALPERLEIQVGVISNEERIDVVGSTMIAMDDTGQTMGYIWYPETPEQILFGLCFENEMGDPAVMYKADILNKHSLQYDNGYPAAEDYALWAAASKFAGFYNIRQPLVKYRIHGAQMSSQSAIVQRLSADRISSGLLGSFIPGFTLSSPERQVLSILYHFCLRKQLPISRMPEFIPAAELGLAGLPGGSSGIETIRSRGLLEDILRHFVAHYSTRDAALRHLCENGSKSAQR